MAHTEYDAVVVGAGPNGLAAAITLQKNGLKVLILEGKETIGGGLRTKELTLPGFTHDVCAAIHPLALGSPFFASLPLAQYGLEFIQPPIAAAHPFDNGSAAALLPSLEDTARGLGADAETYLKLMKPFTESWSNIASNILGPLRIPSHPLDMARFGIKGILPAQHIAKLFTTPEAKGLWAGMAAHSMLPLSHWATSAIGLVLSAVGHKYGWPIPKGGSKSIAEAMAAYFIGLGGKIETNTYITSMAQLPSARAILFDITPKQLLNIAGTEFSSLYKWQLSRYRYGMGVFKIDWALSGPAPFSAAECRQAGTVHLGGSFAEIAKSEYESFKGMASKKPYVLFAQQSVFDTTRAPQGLHTAWAYCHVPNGSTLDMTEAIESQVERFAPGFKSLILAKHTYNAVQMEQHNPNYIGGDINGGVIDLTQLFTRPALRLSPYRTSAKGVYICSSSTPPGGGVHGMCGYYAALRAIKDLFRHEVNLRGLDLVNK